MAEGRMTAPLPRFDAASSGDSLDAAAGRWDKPDKPGGSLLSGACRGEASWPAKPKRLLTTALDSR
jgi:hypothetical protein